MKKLSAKSKKQIELGIIISVCILTIIFWNSVVIYPIKLFVVLLHEMSHGLAAIFTGGKIVSMEVTSNLGGKCVTHGGNTIIISSAGYIGSLLWGWALFYSGYNFDFSIWFNSFLAAFLILITANFLTGAAGVIVTLVFAVIILLSPRLFNKTVHAYLMKFLGIISCLYVVADIREDLLTTEYRQTDAQMIADLTGIPAVLIGIVWFAISVGAVYLLFKLSYKKGMKKK